MEQDSGEKMKRGKITLYLDCDQKPYCVEAYCLSCTYWERHESTEIQGHNTSAVETLISTHGECHRYPNQRNKHQDDWCGEFQPDAK